MFWILFIFLGAAAGAHIVIVNIADYPRPDGLTGKLWGVLTAGALGGLLGGFLFGNLIASSDPMPGREILGGVGVIAAGLVVSTGAALLVGLHIKPQTGR